MLPNIAQLDNLTSFGTQFRLFVDHDDMNNMTGINTSSTNQLGKNVSRITYSLILPSLKYLETMRILMQA
jgi:hypothetical protein